MWRRFGGRGWGEGKRLRFLGHRRQSRLLSPWARDGSVFQRVRGNIRQFLQIQWTLNFV